MIDERPFGEDSFMGILAFSKNRSRIAKISIEGMAHLAGIDNLPQDAMREILLRVAKPPNGASDIAKLFTVSKGFQHFTDDSDVLRAVSFRELFLRYWQRYPNVLGLFEQLLEERGLVARSAIAGNTDAQFLISKVVMICASTLLNARVVTHIPSAGNQYFPDLARTSDFLTNFSDRNMHSDLVKLFLSRAKLEVVKHMKEYIVDFVVYFAEPGKENDLQPFLASLSEFCKMASLTLNHDSLERVAINNLCIMGNRALRDIGYSEEQRRPLLQSLVTTNDIVELETLIERLDTVEPILKVGWEIVQDIEYDFPVKMDRLHCIASLVRSDLMVRASIVKARTELMSKFLAHL